MKFQPIDKKPLDAAIVKMQQDWKASGIPDLYEGGDGPVSRERARNVRAVFYPKPQLPHGSIEHLTIPGPAGQMAVRIVRPLQGEPLGTLVYYHGGGFILGDLDSHEAHAIRLANQAQVVVLNVDYRLAPEQPFPAAIDDADAAVAWAQAHLDQLGGAGRPLAVGGDSAGGNLAAATALFCRDQGIALAAQLLLYPVTDLTLLNGIPEQAYLGDKAAKRGFSPRASPMLAPSLAGLAPAIIGVGSYDFLYQDNMNYANALAAANVPVVLRQYPDLNHGFFSYTAISAPSVAAAEQLCVDLRTLMQR
jgi:acetyl esterase/lipase